MCSANILLSQIISLNLTKSNREQEKAANITPPFHIIQDQLPHSDELLVYIVDVLVMDWLLGKRSL